MGTHLRGMLHEAGAEALFRQAVGAAVMALEAVVLALILWAAALAVVDLVRTRRRHEPRGTDGVRQRFGRHLLLALDFAIGSDVLKVAVAPTLEAAAIAALVVLVRVVLTFALEHELKGARREREAASSMSEGDGTEPPASPMGPAKPTSRKPA